VTHTCIYLQGENESLLGVTHTCIYLQGENELSERLLGVINNSGQLFMVPAKVKQNYVIRFCVCSTSTTNSDIERAWNVISYHAGMCFINVPW